MIDNINAYQMTIKFIATWEMEEVSFLDTQVCIKNGLIETDLHVKAMDTHQYLWVDTFQFKHCKTAISCEETLHLQSICSKQNTTENGAKN